MKLLERPRIWVVADEIDLLVYKDPFNLNQLKLARAQQTGNDESKMTSTELKK